MSRIFSRPVARNVSPRLTNVYTLDVADPCRVLRCYAITQSICADIWRVQWLPFVRLRCLPIFRYWPSYLSRQVQKNACLV